MNQVKVNFINKLSDFFKTSQLDFSGKNLCVCLSGGADSVSLLRGVIEISEEFGFSICACHFNHMIRGSAAGDDEIFCKALCADLGVKIFCGRDDVPSYAKLNKLSIETAARECRYAFFERIKLRNNIDYCLTAHNMDDDAETLLFNLIRGSGSNGASSIAPIKGFYLRPLLKIKRDEIISFLNEVSQSFVVDETNNSLDYTRNYIRHVIIPDAKKINPSVIEALSRYVDSCREDREYFDFIVKEYSDADLRTLHSAVRKKVIIKKFKEFSGLSLNSELIEVIDNAIFSVNRDIIPIYDKFEAIVCEGKLRFYIKDDHNCPEFDDMILKEGSNDVFNGRITINLLRDNFVNTENFNKMSISSKISFDNIVGRLFVRNRRVGDKICIRRINRSVKKLLIEKKIPREYRDILPILCDDVGIIYIPFVGFADRVYTNNDELNVQIIFNTITKERWNFSSEKE